MYKTLLIILLFIPLLSYGEWSTHRFSIGLGYTYLDTTIQVGKKSLGAFILSTEDTLGLDDTQASLRLQYEWRFTKNKKHGLTTGWYRQHRNARRVLAQDIKYVDKDNNEVIIRAGTSVDTLLNFDIIRLAYSYSFFLDERVNISAGAGFYIMPLEFAIGETGKTKTQSDFIAPLPTFQLKSEVKITPKWTLSNEFNIFYIQIGDYTGSIIATNLFIDYLFYKSFSVGLGLEAFKLKVDMEETSDVFDAEVGGELNFGNNSLVARVRYEL
ncbi:outer membrane protein beta-barrel domain protein [Bacteriovorax sp. BAL6_X]|uniref:hypothetical protein n=1 Tax=Bacteriovorax sp. BAL6_X TaxID=1201290 RepID=UPI000386D431|nr:hypothetical protein [Bacteriovorax sp. BAL6_X]EPZ49487.1 outer membrane protein beta-barrel domain protein [Bacteriovorax sp. BAL6_X]